MNNLDPSVSLPTQIESIRTSGSATLRTINYFAHAVKMLENLENQNSSLIKDPAALKKIYGNAQEQVLKINERVQFNLKLADPKKQEKVKSLTENLRQANLTSAEQKGKQSNLIVQLKHLEEKEKRLSKQLESAEDLLPVQEELSQIRSEIKKLTGSLVRLDQHILKTSKAISTLTEQIETLKYDLSKKDVKNLKSVLKEAEEELVSIIHQTQVDVAAEVAKEKAGTDPKTSASIQSKAAALARGGWGAFWIRFLSLVSSTNRLAIHSFNEAVKSMDSASKTPFAPVPSESKIDRDKRKEFDQYLAGQISLERRAGVIGINGIYRVKVEFAKERIHKQLKSFIAQNLGNCDRQIIQREFKTGGLTYMSELIPLNSEFDRSLAERGALSSKVFASIFGTKGISSANRQESHLINGYESNLVQNGNTIFRALRHAITADRYEKDPATREINAKKAAKELIKAALLQEIASQGLTLEEASKKRVHLNLNSVSLVTPDDVRPHLSGQANERKMLLDQVLALNSFAGDQTIKLDGIDIPVTVQVNTFNFGVNFLANNLGWGLDNQYQHNLKALEGLRDHLGEFYNVMAKEITDLLQVQSSHLSETIAAKKAAEDCRKDLENAKRLMNDIELLMKDKKAYLAGENQYEIGANILNLCILMDKGIERINQTRSLDKRISGFKAAFNCMSGKDRTGLLDAIGKTIAIMAQENGGRYFTHEDFKKPEVQERFVEILCVVLQKSGSIDITEINTGAKGFKVGKEARLFGMPITRFLQAQGLSSTTSS